MTNLISRGLNPTGAASNTLVSHDGNLLIMKMNSLSAIDRTVVVTPQEEYYTCAASYGLYNYGEVDDGAVYPQHGRTVTDNIASAFNAKMVDSWVSGHKSCFMYWVRGRTDTVNPNDKGTADPWYMKTTSKTGSDALVEGRRTIGSGASWSQAYFNLYGFPIKMARTCYIYLRIYNPSLVAYDSTFGNSDFYDRETNVPPASGIGSNSAVMLYNFSAEQIAPSAFNTESNQAATIAFTDLSIVNQGVSNFTNGMDTTGNTSPKICFYDPWNSALTGDGYMASIYGLRRYRPDNNNTPYYVDVLLPDRMKNKLMELQYDGAGGIWLTFGPAINYFFTANMQLGYSCLMYFSRLELVLDYDIYGFNYQ